MARLDLDVFGHVGTEEGIAAKDKGQLGRPGRHVDAGDRSPPTDGHVQILAVVGDRQLPGVRPHEERRADDVARERVDGHDAVGVLEPGARHAGVDPLADRVVDDVLGLDEGEPGLGGAGRARQGDHAQEQTGDGSSNNGEPSQHGSSRGDFEI